MELDKRILEVNDLIVNYAYAPLSQEKFLSEIHRYFIGTLPALHERLFTTYNRYLAVSFPLDAEERQERLKEAVHDLRMPVAIMITCSDVLAEEDKSQWSEKAKIAFAQVRTNIHRLVEILDELLIE